tara:strand:- start:588 stop:722 length:135 start_codon:yes stop_codon:yes gene_type:complete
LKGRETIMSVYAEGLMRKAYRQLKKNYEETGIYETNIQRERREK